MEGVSPYLQIVHIEQEYHGDERTALQVGPPFGAQAIDSGQGQAPGNGIYIGGLWGSARHSGMLLSPHSPDPRENSALPNDPLLTAAWDNYCQQADPCLLLATSGSCIPGTPNIRGSPWTLLCTPYPLLLVPRLSLTLMWSGRGCCKRRQTC